MAWDGLDRLWVANGVSGHYKVFDSDGRFLRTQRRPVNGVARRQHALRYRPDGRMLDEASAWPRVLFLAIDTTQDLRVDTLGELEQPPMSEAIAHRPLLPGSELLRVVTGYAVRRMWALGPDETLWVCDSDRVRLVQRTLGGDTLRIVETSHRSGRLSAWEQWRIRRTLRRSGLGSADILLAKRIVQALYVSDDGHVLVQVQEHTGEDSPVFDVFDPEGRYLGEVNLGFSPSRTGHVTLSGDTLVAPVIGDDEVPYVVVSVFERGQ